MDYFQFLVVIVVLSPLAGSMLTGLFCNYFSKTIVVFICLLMMGCSTLSSVILFYKLCMYNTNGFEFTVYSWGTLSNLHLEVGFLIDRLTTFMFLIVSFISLMVHIYTISYMEKDAGFKKFFCYISFFTFSMLMLVGANNFLQLFFGWEAVGLASYLLIGFWFKKESAIFANLKAFIVNRIGDFSFILGIAGIFFYFGTLNYLDVFKQVVVFFTKNTTIMIIPGLQTTALTVICICLFIGAMGKSAQMPLHVWLPDSMEGPTPISALIHAATMVTAGIFMTARMSPLFEYSNAALSFILVVGTCTCFFMGLLGIVQNDIKRIIAYSTLSQLGLMVASLGVSCYSFSLFHLMTHAFFKALLFLCAGSVIIGMHHVQDIRVMGNLRRYMPITYITMLIGSLALSGFPGFSGFYSKDLILESLYYSQLVFSSIAYYIIYISVFITAFYTFRLFFIVFHTHKNLINTHHDIPHESSFIIVFPLIVLSIPSVVVGFLFLNYIFEGYFYDSIFLKDIISPFFVIKNHYHGVIKMFYHGILSGPCILCYLGIFSSWFFYVFRPFYLLFIVKNLMFFYNILLNGYWFDYFNLYIVKCVNKVGEYLYYFGDRTIIDEFFINGSANFVLKIAQRIRKIQTGLLYHYVFFMLFSLFIFLLWLLIK